MSLFNKTQIDPKIIPFIQKAEAVGVVKIQGYGKASARIETNKLIIESYEHNNNIVEPISAITLLSYYPGNFINEPKLTIGVNSKQYILAGVDDNDTELEQFYNTLLGIKNREKHGPLNKNGMPRPNQQITNPKKAPQSDSFAQPAQINENNIQMPEEEIKQADPVDEIRRYYQLKEDGIITEEEFEKKKKQLLDL